MNFIVVLPHTRRKNDLIWVIIERLTKPSNFIPIKSTYSAEEYAKLYLKEIVRMHGFSLSIISERGNQFTSHFLESIPRWGWYQGEI